MTTTEIPPQMDRDAHARAVADAAHGTIYEPTAVPDTFVHRRLLPNLGGVVALLLLPACLIGGISAWSWVIVMAVWGVSRLGQAMTMRMVTGLPQTIAVGAAGFGMMLRVWLIATVLFFVGADLKLGKTHLGAGRTDIAVPAMLMFMLVLTVDIAVRSYTELMRYKGVSPAQSDSSEGTTQS